jgi:hypothetical protein
VELMAEHHLAWAKLDETPMQLYNSQHISQLRERLLLEPGVCLDHQRFWIRELVLSGARGFVCGTGGSLGSDRYVVQATG